MKKSNLLFSIFTALLFFGAVMVLSNCEGPEGPEGPAGSNGTNGTDGTNGVDGNVTCLECHGKDVKSKIMIEFTGSQHALGDIGVAYAGGRTSCARCHSHEGYVEYTGTGDVANIITNPSAWKCNTCHDLHKSFDSTDYAFRHDDSVTLLTDGTTVIDEGNNNVCMFCHQARRGGDYYLNAYTTATTQTRKFTGADIAIYTYAAVGPAGSATLNGSGDTLTVVFDIPLTHAYISSTHAGPHHGPQAQTWQGIGGYTATAGTPYSSHSGGCVKCHMGIASGHSFWPEDGNCIECHGAKTTAMDAIEDRIDAIAHELETIHAIHEDDGYHPLYASLTKDEFKAFWNFMLVIEDKSLSAHNPTYIKALLSEAETTLGI